MAWVDGLLLDIVAGAPGNHPPLPHCRERQAEVVIVHLSLHSREWTAVVGGYDHERVFQFAAALERVEKAISHASRMPRNSASGE